MKPAQAMLAIILSASLTGLGAMAEGQARSESAGKGKVFTPTDVQWKAAPASLPPGARLAVLEGDPTKEGPYTMRLAMPDGYRIPPHTHPKTERVTVVTGTFRLGMGDTFDEKALQALPVGAYGFLPAGMRHFAQAQGETVIQLHGTGPWEIIYVNPADDPRRTVK